MDCIVLNNTTKMTQVKELKVFQGKGSSRLYCSTKIAEQSVLITTLPRGCRIVFLLRFRGKKDFHLAVVNTLEFYRTILIYRIFLLKEELEEMNLSRNPQD
jgi:hypothetical protein